MARASRLGVSDQRRVYIRDISYRSGLSFKTEVSADVPINSSSSRHQESSSAMSVEESPGITHARTGTPRRVSGT